MSIIVSTSCLNGYSCLTELVSDLQAMGLTHIELSASPPVNEDDLAHLSKIRMNLSIHNYFPPADPPFVLNLASQNPISRASSIGLAKRAINLTNTFGCSFYSVHAGIRAEVAPSSLGGRLDYGTIVDYNTTHAQMVNSLRILCDYAKRQSITIGVENNVLSRINLVEGRNELVPYCESWELQTLILDVDRPNLGILLDVGHLAVTAATLNFDRWQFIEQIAPHVLAIHVSDNNTIADQHCPIQPDSWVLDVLRQPKFVDLPIIIEAKFKNVNDLCEHVNWLRLELEK